MEYWHTKKMYQMEMTGFECNMEHDYVLDIEYESMKTDNNDDDIFDRLQRTPPGKEDADEYCLFWFNNAFCPSILHTFIGYIPNRDYENKFDGTILIIVRLNA